MGVSNGTYNQTRDKGREDVHLSFREKLSPKSNDKKVAIKSGDKKAAIKSGDKITVKMQEHFDAALASMKPGELYQAADFCDILGTKISRTKVILKKMTDMELIESIGTNKNRRYKNVTVK